MATAGPILNLPSRQDIIDINHYHIAETGGLFVPPNNLRQPGSLDWVLDAIQVSVFGVDRYPSLEHKAAGVAYVIIAGHVFHDGSKRTGMSAIKAILDMNGFDLHASADDVIEIALSLAGGHGQPKLAFDAFVEWIADRMKLQPYVR